MLFVQKRSCHYMYHICFVSTPTPPPSPLSPLSSPLCLSLHVFLPSFSLPFLFPYLPSYNIFHLRSSTCVCGTLATHCQPNRHSQFHLYDIWNPYSYLCVDKWHRPHSSVYHPWHCHHHKCH